jgi:hypothetical protein
VSARGSVEVGGFKSFGNLTICRDIVEIQRLAAQVLALRRLERDRTDKMQRLRRKVLLALTDPTLGIDRSKAER